MFCSLFLLWLHSYIDYVCEQTVKSCSQFANIYSIFSAHGHRELRVPKHPKHTQAPLALRHPDTVDCKAESRTGCQVEEEEEGTKVKETTQSF